MNQKMKNRVLIRCRSAKLTEYTDVVVDLEQDSISMEFTPTIVDDENAYIDITKTQATQLAPSIAKLQMLYTDEDGMPQMTNIKSMTVNEMLREAAYGD